MNRNLMQKELAKACKCNLDSALRNLNRALEVDQIRENIIDDLIAAYFHFGKARMCCSILVTDFQDRSMLPEITESEARLYEAKRHIIGMTDQGGKNNAQ